ncbi:hypothetical protein ATY41_00965 [Leifsonia xyli subsp. xyli]|uniref:Uncharacterized protein n=1 Tax=Leifsonia xyli subsp. xyli TaxID=59736 RepID=A0A1E2SNV2_LEIXY|nr:hypothetical protein [Leifsonia xyli]ODA91294.1 hypothetical protein ATY41_00965 [Leifsonia xyli subsp. xyli]
MSTSTYERFVRSSRRASIALTESDAFFPLIPMMCEFSASSSVTGTVPITETPKVFSTISADRTPRSSWFRISA